jgi:uncharacterized damage-inducible protein DinB
MTMIDPFLMELEQEGQTTRRVLERVPTDKLDWRPHPTARSLGELAMHVATSQRVVSEALQKPSYEGQQNNPVVPANAEDIVAQFDDCTSSAKKLLSAMSDQDLMSEWSLTAGGVSRFRAPKIGVIRGIVLNHTYHHRGQLSVYLRQLGLKVPSIYGPSGDENPFM